MFIVMDLEFNCSNNNYVSEKNGIRLPNEIIEIGAVKLDDDLNEVDRFCSFIKPTVYSKMNTEVRKLTNITTDMIHSGIEFTEAIKEFLDWCGDGSFVTWSESDIIMIEDNMLYHGLEIDGLPRCFDIQPMFSDQIMDEDRNYALTYALWKLGITPAIAHDALNDALNTAEVLRKLDLSEGLDDYEV